MRVAMIGSGYVGLVSGACFADFGHEVVCIDRDVSRIEGLLAGRMPIWEPGLEAIVNRNVAEGRLSFTMDLAAAVADCEVVFIAVGTPPRNGDGHADLSHVFEAAREAALAAVGPLVLVTKSTVPVGTGDTIERVVNEVRPGFPISVASNPEFLREGAAIDDFKRPDRVVIGCQDTHSREVLEALYRPLSLNSAPIFVTDRRTAETVKYANNAFLATKVAFINDIADLCERVGADVQHVARAMGMDKRIGAKFLNPGPGYGGSCFPKDTVALVRTAQDYGVPMRVVEAVIASNTARKSAMALKVAEAVGGSLMGRTVAVLGLAFKSNTDDVRESPAIAIVEAMQRAGAKVRAYDPAAMGQAARLLQDVEFCDGPYTCALDADVLVVVTEWDAFRAIDLVKARRAMRGDVLVDLRNVYRPEDAERAGFRYTRIGGRSSRTLV